jgi:organic hydroperoxide reductase OsmC/OhrA
MKNHVYRVSLDWVGNLGSGTSGYKAYSRDHVIQAPGKPDIVGSSDRIFHGNPERWNPEELLIAALSQCHMLSFLHVASEAGIIVTGYLDKPEGTLSLDAEGGGKMTDVCLRPEVTATGDPDVIAQCHHRASELCFIANSVNFPVRHEPTVVGQGSL